MRQGPAQAIGHRADLFSSTSLNVEGVLFVCFIQVRGSCVGYVRFKKKSLVGVLPPNMSQPSNNPTTAVSMEAEPVARPSIAGAGQKRNGSAVGVEKPPEKVRPTSRTLTWLVACLVAQADGDQVGLPAEKMRVSPCDFLDTIAPVAPA